MKTARIQSANRSGAKTRGGASRCGVSPRVARLEMDCTACIINPENLALDRMALPRCKHAQRARRMARLHRGMDPFGLRKFGFLSSFEIRHSDFTPVRFRSTRS